MEADYKTDLVPLENVCSSIVRLTLIYSKECESYIIDTYIKIHIIFGQRLKLLNKVSYRSDLSQQGAYAVHSLSLILIVLFCPLLFERPMLFKGGYRNVG